MGLKYDYFGSKVKEDLITVRYTENQLEDLLTKALYEDQFMKLGKHIHVWQFYLSNLGRE